MVLPLLRRGLLAGVLAGLVAAVFAFLVGEPRLQDAIDLENAQASLVLAHVADWAVSRDEQRGGLFLAMALYGAAVGTVFALAFALARGRVPARSDWHLAVGLAAALFCALVLVPFLKYPANPPGVGDPETIGPRTWQYLVLVAGAVAALVAALRVARLVPPASLWLRPVCGAGTFVALCGVLAIGLPGVEEVPADFPPTLLWEFRLSALGAQAVLWSVLGVAFGVLALRDAR